MNEWQWEKNNRPRDWPKDACEILGLCPICSSTDRELLHGKLVDYAFECAPGEWTMYQCGSCGVAYLDPRPNQETIGQAYEQYYTHPGTEPGKSRMRDLKLAALNGYRNFKFGVNFSPSNKLGALYYLFPGRRKNIDSEGRGIEKMPDDQAAKVLDVGSGDGAFLVLAKMMGWQAFGVEPDPAAANAAREAGVELLGEVVDDVPEEYNGSFDVITLSHVIEHVHNPPALIEKCHELLREGGRLWIETPNIDSQGLQRYGKYWRGLEAPRHLIIFNWNSLRELLEKAGFSEVCREAPRPVCKWMFEQSLPKTGSSCEQDSLVGKLKFSLVVFVADLHARIDSSRHELLSINSKKCSISDQ